MYTQTTYDTLYNYITHNRRVLGNCKLHRRHDVCNILSCMVRRAFMSDRISFEDAARLGDIIKEMRSE